MQVFDIDRLSGARSAVVQMKPDNQGRYEFTFWLQYTRQALANLNVGDLIAADSYALKDERGRQRFSILSITEIHPEHFAKQAPDAYPGHVFEAMRGIRQEWEAQDDRPRHHTTTIIGKAVATPWQIVHNVREGDPDLEAAGSLPMIGSEVMPLHQEMVDRIVNQGLESAEESCLAHREFPEINVKLSWEKLLSTHFGIFGFTGVGKSNLVSSLATSLFEQKERPASLVIVDPNDEYLGLLLDHFVHTPERVLYVNVGIHGLSNEVIQTLGKPRLEIPSGIVERLARTMQLPEALRGGEMDSFIKRGLEAAIHHGKIVFPAKGLRAHVFALKSQRISGSTGIRTIEVVDEALNVWLRGLPDDELNLPNVQTLVDRALNSFDACNPFSEVDRQFQPGPSGQQDSKATTAKGYLVGIRTQLQKLVSELQMVPAEALTTTSELVTRINTAEKPMLVVVAGGSEQETKAFVSTFGDALYEARRVASILKPHVAFVLDEADLFIPNDSRDEQTDEIRRTAMTIARRGRKFGMGIGIATQRSTHLDTQVMGNLHTYFVSKLPREGDRGRVAEAFGIGEDQLAPTFAFSPGDWLVISHDATGLRGVPIPCRSQDANARILRAAAQAATIQGSSMARLTRA